MSLSRPRRVCMFCGGTPLSKEHLVPVWISKAISKWTPTGANREYRTSKSLWTGQRRDTTSSREFSQKARCVCEACNNVWMSQVEEAAKPFLEPMIWGEEIELDPDAQRAIALWAALHAVVWERAHPPIGTTLPPEWLAHLHQTRSLPASWRVWLGGFTGRPDFAYSTVQIRDPIAMPRREDERPSGVHGSVTTIILGELVIKVLAVDRQPFRDPADEALLSVWPPTEPAFMWPPARVWTGESVEHLFGLWLGGENQLGTILKGMN